MAVGEVEVLFPVEVGDVVLAITNMVADVVANGLVGFWLPGHSDAF